jgi:hypothetical protein
MTIGHRSCRWPVREPQSGPAATHERPARAWPMTNLARASASGAVSFAAAQLIDIRLTGRPSSDTPVRAVEMLIRRPVKGPLLRTVLAYGVQSSLAPTAVVAASLAGASPTRRLGAAFLAPVAFVALVNPALGVSTWPWRWTAGDWVRELTLKSVLAIAVTAAL